MRTCSQVASPSVRRVADTFGRLEFELDNATLALLAPASPHEDAISLPASCHAVKDFNLANQRTGRRNLFLYKTRERIHRSEADLRLLAIPTSWGRVADPNLNWGKFCWDWLRLTAWQPIVPSHCSTCVAQDIRAMLI